jgi:hypothetical protein
MDRRELSEVAAMQKDILSRTELLSVQLAQLSKKLSGIKEFADKKQNNQVQGQFDDADEEGQLQILEEGSERQNNQVEGQFDVAEEGQLQIFEEVSERQNNQVEGQFDVAEEGQLQILEEGSESRLPAAARMQKTELKEDAAVVLESEDVVFFCHAEEDIITAAVQLVNPPENNQESPEMEPEVDAKGRRFRCHAPLCGRWFHHFHHFNAHKKEHSGETFVCTEAAEKYPNRRGRRNGGGGEGTICGKTLATKNKLFWHKINHHKKCRKCKKQTSGHSGKIGKSELKRHEDKCWRNEQKRKRDVKRVILAKIAAAEKQERLNQESKK